MMRERPSPEADPGFPDFDREVLLPDGKRVRYRLDFVANAEQWMVTRAARQTGGQAKFRTVRITVHPEDRQT